MAHPRLAAAALLLLAGCGSPEPESAARAASAETAPAPASPPADGWLEPVREDGGTGAAQEEYLRAVRAASLPQWAHERARQEGHTRTFALSFALNPFFQSGDFDGDRRLDVAVLVSRRATGETGILLLHRVGTPSTVIGAGEPFGNGGADFRWMTGWRVRPQEEGSPRRDALEVVKAESAGGLIYRDDTGYRWRQTDD